MTFMEWCESHPAVAATRLEGGAWQLFTTDASVFQITDYHVSSAVSGPAVILVPREVAP